MNKQRGLIGLMLGIGVLLVAEATLVAAVMVSPSARVAVSAKLAGMTEVLAGSEDTPGLAGRVSGGAGNFFRTWAEPLWSGPTSKPSESGFEKCISCHADYAATERTGAVRMSHPLHAQQDITCGKCHTENEHPDPGIPSEKGCATCHEETKSTDKCSFCHPVGSLPHYYLVGVPRDGAVDCGTCHAPGVIAMGAGRSRLSAPSFTGKDQKLCSSCHEKTVCAQCHAEKHPSNWLQVHGGGEAAPCLTCHRYEWCGERCHNPAPPRSISTRFTGEF